MLFLVGLGCLLLLHRERLPLGIALLAPSFGLAAFVIPSVFINQLGVPVGRFALFEILVLSIAAAAVLVWRRKLVPWRSLALLSPLIALAFVLIAWPQFVYGFNWVSFSNDDMTNYALGADRFVTHGFFQPPPLRPDEIYRGYTAFYWFLYALGGMRAGVEVLLALVAAVTHLRGFQAFMSFILACTLSLVCATAALGWSVRRRLCDAWLVGGLIAVSPLTTLGAVYQLLGQIPGLSTMVGQVAVISAEHGAAPQAARSQIRLGLSVGTLVAAQTIMYPESLPFSALMYAAWGTLLVLRERANLRRLAVAGATALATVGILAVSSLPRMLSFLVLQFVHGFTPSSARDVHTWFLFPYFLVPSGPSSLWGFSLITTFGGLFLSVGIGAGLILTVVTGAAAVLRAARKSEPASIMLLVMLALGLVLFIKRDDFGLFKLAMYIQPFLLATFGALAVTALRLRPALLAAAAALLLVAPITQWGYVQTSVNGKYGVAAGLVEVPYATPKRLLQELSEIERRSAPVDAYVSDTNNYVVGKYETGFVGTRPLFFLTQGFARAESIPGTPLQVLRPILRPRFAARAAYAARLLRDGKRFVSSGTFVFPGHERAAFTAPVPLRRYRRLGLLHLGGVGTVLNRSMRGYDGRIVYFVRLGDIRDDLAFVTSSVGSAPGATGDVTKESLFQVEPDYFRRGTTMAGIGRYLLLAVLNPTPHARMLIDITDTLVGDGKDRLPPASITGRERLLFPLVGSGSARVVSAPVDPRVIDGYNLLGLDMGVPGRYFHVPRVGLMRLYGRGIALDPRLLTTFARNISLISGAQYRAMRPPAYIADLPKALTDPNLLYSGIYEDGWVSDHAALTLRSRGGAEWLTVRGFVPIISAPDFETSLRCSVDGHVVGSSHLKVGEFLLRFSVALTPGKHIVSLDFSAFQHLPSGDGRPVSAKILGVGFR